MTKSNFSTAARNTLALLALILLFASSTYAQEQEKMNRRITKNAIASIISGIHDDVKQVKTDCIFIAGRYKIRETVDALAEELQKETEPSIKLLISLSLFMIGEEKGIMEVYKASLTEDNKILLKRFNEVVYDFYNNKNQRYSMK
jgi:hypothetical protein